MDALRVLGAEVKLVPAVPFDNPDNYNHQVRGNPSFVPRPVRHFRLHEKTRVIPHVRDVEGRKVVERT